MKGMHGMGHQHHSGTRPNQEAEPVRGTEAGESKQEGRVAEAGANDPVSTLATGDIAESAKAVERIKAASGARVT